MERRYTGQSCVQKNNTQFFNIHGQSGRYTIAEVEHLVQPGEIDPDDVHVAGVYVHRIFEGKDYEKRIERKTVKIN
jgi:3-oxoacid CoA-transferase subunit A